MEVQLQEALATTRRMAEILAHHTRQPIERVERDIDRDFYLTAEEARVYGIVDDIITPRRGVAALTAAVVS
jgi:ATP-dependent Clp protease protease subunit